MELYITDKRVGPILLCGGLFFAAIASTFLRWMLGFNSRWFALSYPFVLIVGDLVARAYREQADGHRRFALPQYGGHLFFVPVWCVGLALACYLSFLAVYPPPTVRPEDLSSDGSRAPVAESVPGGVVGNSNVNKSRKSQ